MKMKFNLPLTTLFSFLFFRLHFFTFFLILFFQSTTISHATTSPSLQSILNEVYVNIVENKFDVAKNILKKQTNSSLIFIGENLNDVPAFDGPNCYNTALRASEILPINKLRYVDPVEFEILLKHFFKPIENQNLPQLGDIVVFGAHSSRDHSAYYLSENMVFHRKSYGIIREGMPPVSENMNLKLRILPINEVYDLEGYEKNPSPMDYNHYEKSDKEHAIKDRLFYRKNLNISVENNLYKMKLNSHELKAAEMINFLEINIINNASNESIANEMGWYTEEFLDLLLSKFNFLNESSNFYAQWFYAKIKSLKWQVFVNIQGRFFTSPFSLSKEDKYRYENLFQFNNYLSKFVREVLKYNGQVVNENNINKIIEKIKKLDRNRKDIDLFQIAEE
ncbi:MAG: hypothetical protein HQK51_17020 [Oligoflexia bacterium]|nr:hypothetical protein [Oligoflexia bacterium]